MLILHLLECTLKGYDHISDLLLAKYRVITGYKYAGCTSLEDVYCYAENPPQIQYYTFYRIPSDAVLHVPAASVERYRVGEYWSGFFKQILAL